METTRQEQKPRRQSFLISDILAEDTPATPPTLFQHQKERLDVTTECSLDDTTETESLSQNSTGEGGMHERACSRFFVHNYTYEFSNGS